MLQRKFSTGQVSYAITKASTSILHSHKYVIQGDATVHESYSKLGLGIKPENRLADVIITDPPYCLLERRRTGGDLRDPKSRQRKLDDQPTVPRFPSVSDYKSFTKSWFPLCIQHAKASAVVIVWTNALGKSPILSVASSCGYEAVGEYLWAKRTTTTVKENSTKNEVLLRVYETALVFQPKAIAMLSKTRQPRSDEKSICWHVVTGYHEGNNDQAIPHPHPCHKPFAALEPLVRQWTKPNDLVLDPFAGSGGILVAVEKIGDRKVIGIEKLSEWVEGANRAIATANDIKPQI